MLRWVIRENSPIVRAVAMCNSVAPPAGGESRAFPAGLKAGRTLDSPAGGGLSVVPRNDKGGPDDPGREAPAAKCEAAGRRTSSGTVACLAAGVLRPEHRGSGHPRG